jgi:glycosyltransferase involved in cell wall biosynthesis
MFSPSRLPDDSEGRTVVSIGRLSPVKDHEVLIRAAAILLQRPTAPPFRVRVVGGSANVQQEPYVERLERLITDQGLEDVVELVGGAHYAEIPTHLSRSHLFVSASRTGSLDKAVLEAMACGRPVLTSSPSFRDELAGHEDRLMFRAGDPEDLAAHLEDLLREDLASLQQIGTALAESVAERHELEAFADRLVGAIEEAVDTPSEGSTVAPGSR